MGGFYLENVLDEEVDIDDTRSTGIENASTIVYETLEQGIHRDGIGMCFQGKGGRGVFFNWWRCL